MRVTGGSRGRQTEVVADALVDDVRVAAWMDEQGIATGAPLTLTRITTGHSNEVFKVERGDLVAVLRRPPRTPLSPTAHDMAREFRVLQALHDDAGWHARRAVPVPVPIACCTDMTVIGAPFYLMHLVDGVVVRESLPDSLAVDPGAARACALELVDALAGIHAFDWRAGGLDGFGRPDGYLERQVPRWLGQLERYKTRPIPEVDEAGEWLAARIPPAQPPGVIHGDYKLDNVMFAPGLPVELVAVVDWEQSTIGDPLVDLGWVLGLWADPGDPASAAGVTPFAGRSDVATRRELLDRYADDTDRDLANVNYYCVLGLFKLACVMEGSFARFRAGTSDDAYFASLERGVPALARRALEFASSDLL
jgi:aminoglycoside phosphotransferase (APT) family kinase protein